MKKLFICLTLISSLTAYADNCSELLQDPNWPEDMNEMVLDCTLTSVNVGTTDYDRICFSVSRTQYSRYKTTDYKTLRLKSDAPGGLMTIVSENEKGRVFNGDDITRKGTVYTVSAEKYSFEFNQRWIESTIVDIKNPTSLTFKIYDKKFFSTKLKDSATYSCFREL